MKEQNVTNTAEWQIKKQNKKVVDDGTLTFFWRDHTVLVLICMCAVLTYISLFEIQINDIEYNKQRGIIYCAIFFVLFGVTQSPNGPFIRPHPAFWKLILVLSVLYEICLVYLLFQTVDGARDLFKHIDPSLGKPLPEKSYGGTCLIYDANEPNNPFHNFWDKMDGFVVNHFIGWYFKAIVIRDWWICFIMSMLFEFLEYSLEHQLPNFSECWWDHWVLDFLICNSLGIYLGLKTCDYFSMKPYNWRGVKNIPSFRGKCVRCIQQFSPYNWIQYDWRPMKSLKHWVIALLLIFVYELGELSTFYLKYIFWIPAPHYLVLGRLIFLLLGSAVAVREGFEYLDNPLCKRFGSQCWVSWSIIYTEVLIVLKFDWQLVTKPFPKVITYSWIGFGVFLSVWTLWHFYLKPAAYNSEFIDETSSTNWKNKKKVK